MSVGESDIWSDDDDNLAATILREPASQPTRSDAFFGCPLWWVERVYPLVRSKAELLVAIYLWRLRVISRSRTVIFSNSGLPRRLTIDRFTKSRVLRRLAEAGLVRVQNNPGKAPRVTFLGR